MVTTPERISKSWTVRKDLVDRLEKEADERALGERLLVEKALESYLDALRPIDLPAVAAVAKDGVEFGGAPKAGD